MKPENLSYRFGELDKVLDEKAELVENFQDLYAAGRESDFIIPRVIGVYQSFHSRSGFRPAVEISNHWHNRSEDLSPNLISVVFSPYEFPEKDVLADFVHERNPLKRVKCMSYIQAANPEYFQAKPVLDVERLARISEAALQAKESSQKRSTTTLLERELEHLMLTEQNFGLTIEEAVNKRLVGKTLDYVNGVGEVVVPTKQEGEIFQALEELYKLFDNLGGKQ